MTYSSWFVALHLNQALFHIDKVLLSVENSLADSLKLTLLYDSPVQAHITIQLKIKDLQQQCCPSSRHCI